MKIYTKSGPKIGKRRVDISGAPLQLSFSLHLSSLGNFPVTIHGGLVGGETKKLLLKSVFSQKQ